MPANCGCPSSYCVCLLTTRQGGTVDGLQQGFELRKFSWRAQLVFRGSLASEMQSQIPNHMAVQAQGSDSLCDKSPSCNARQLITATTSGLV